MNRIEGTARSFLKGKDFRVMVILKCLILFWALVSISPQNSFRSAAHAAVCSNSLLLENEQLVLLALAPNNHRLMTVTLKVEQLKL